MILCIEYVREREGKNEIGKLKCKKKRMKKENQNAKDISLHICQLHCSILQLHSKFTAWRDSGTLKAKQNPYIGEEEQKNRKEKPNVMVPCIQFKLFFICCDIYCYLDALFIFVTTHAEIPVWFEICVCQSRMSKKKEEK